MKNEELHTNCSKRLDIEEILEVNKQIEAMVSHLRDHPENYKTIFVELEVLYKKRERLYDCTTVD